MVYILNVGYMSVSYWFLNITCELSELKNCDCLKVLIVELFIQTNIRFLKYIMYLSQVR